MGDVGIVGSLRFSEKIAFDREIIHSIIQRINQGHKQYPTSHVKWSGGYEKVRATVFHAVSNFLNFLNFVNFFNVSLTIGT